MRETIQPLTMIRRSIADAQETRERHNGELATLTDIAWDPDAWGDVTDRFTNASNAAGAVQQIDRELAKRPQLEHDLEGAGTLLAKLESGIAAQEAARDGVGFDPVALEQASVAFTQARQVERERRDVRDDARTRKLNAEHRLDMLLRDEQQLKELAAEAEEKRTLLRELDLMYREFSEFDKYVAQKLTPQLSDITSDIVAAMTDGAYDRVDFDEDYGIQVWDGPDEKFDLETFSGGERDAIALAARLALSRMIGSQAANPPGFLVLDEVFGSLDAERRDRVLTLLGQHSHEFFRQMFIISHIDDVQQSPVFDTIWQVTQTEDGSSEVQPGIAEAALVD
jgi:DNA repair exonuclease SbcCD ATPase subunit